MTMTVRIISAKKHGYPRWLAAALVWLLLSLIVSGCGGPVNTTASGAEAAGGDEAAGNNEAVAEPAEPAEEEGAAAAEAPEEQAEAAGEQAAVTEAESAAAEAEPVAADGDPIKVGVVVTLEGIYAEAGEDSVRAVKLAVAEFGGQINGRPIELSIAGTRADTPEIALEAARKFVEEEKVDIVLGPATSDEGLLIRDYAKEHPEITFMSGTSAAQDITLRDPAPNFFRFSTDGAQWMAGLGVYAFENKGYQRVATLADDYSYTHTQVGGFLVDFCKAGGEIVDKFWVPLGTTDYSEVIAAIPQDVDAIYIALGGSDSLDFLRQYEEAGGIAPLIAGTLSLDQSILGSKGGVADHVMGVPSAGPLADDSPAPAWDEFSNAYQEMFPDAFPSISVFGYTYYINAKAMLLALEEVEGDLSNGQQAFQETLKDLKFEAPTGPVRLDENRQAISNNYITEVSRDLEGELYTNFIKDVKNVDQSLGNDPEAYLQLGSMTRDNPTCEAVKEIFAQ